MAVPCVRCFQTWSTVVGRCSLRTVHVARSVAAVMLVVGATGMAGCAGSQRVVRPGMAAVSPPALAPPPGVAAAAPLLGVSPPVAAGPPPGADGLTAALERSRQESQLMQDEITVLREQLASTSAQLASVRASAAPPPPAAGTAGTATVAPTTMQSALATLALPGVETRFDGAVVRIELPADTLFDGGTANLMPGGAALLTQVAGELGRVYPGHFLGIESHVDTEPLRNASWGSPHQLTAARAAAVFDFLTTRTSLREGQLFLVAHGSNHPVVSNATAAGRAKNRRVELVVYPERTPGE